MIVAAPLAYLAAGFLVTWWRLPLIWGKARRDFIPSDVRYWASLTAFATVMLWPLTLLAAGWEWFLERGDLRTRFEAPGARTPTRHGRTGEEDGDDG